MDLIELNLQEDFESVNRHPWEQARLKLINTLVGKHSDKSKPQTILDVGCGDTYVAEGILKENPNATIYCIDIAFTQEMLDYYSEKYAKDGRIKVYNSLQSSIPDITSNIDCVLFLDVIEHIEDEVAVLKEVRSLDKFTEDTNIIITVPAFQSLFTQHDVQLEHYRRYNRRTLRKSLQESGLKSVDMKFFFTSLLAPRIVEWLKEKITNNKERDVGISAWDKGAGITNVITQILVLDASLVIFLQRLGLPIIGLSLYTIAKKKG